MIRPSTGDLTKCDASAFRPNLRATAAELSLLEDAASSVQATLPTDRARWYLTRVRHQQARQAGRPGRSDRSESCGRRLHHVSDCPIYVINPTHLTHLTYLTCSIQRGPLDPRGLPGLPGPPGRLSRPACPARLTRLA